VNDHSKTTENRAQLQPDCGLGAEPSDAELLASISHGHEDAFWCLWKRHQENLRRVCFQQMGGRAADAEDALSLVMMKALDRLPEGAGKIVRVEPWLHRLAKNLCIDLRRESQRKAETVESWNITDLTESTVMEPPVQGELIDAELLNQIAALPPSLREPFILHVIDEMPSKEVAMRVGLSPANVRKRVQQARSRLRRDIISSRDGLTDRKPPVTPPSPAGGFKSSPWELCTFARAVSTVCIKRPCGVEDLFHVFSAQPPLAPERKIKILQNQLSQHCNNREKRLELAELFYLTGAWAKAADEWRRALPGRPDLAAALKLGDTLLKLGRRDEAAAVFGNARRQGFQSPATPRHLAGWLALCERTAGRATAEFQSAADLEPANPAHWHGLALAHQMAGAMPAALAAVQQALSLNHNDLVALSLSHEMLLATGQNEEATRRAQRLLELAPDDLLTLRRLVDCRCHTGRVHGTDGLETRRLLRRAERLAGNSLLLHETLAAFLLSQGHSQRVLALHRKFIEVYPQCLRVWKQIAELQAVASRSKRHPANAHDRIPAIARHCTDACDGCAIAGLRGPNRQSA
jgi:RNA polymerase sigma-70 factor (ECF subfamily)